MRAAASIGRGRFSGRIERGEATAATIRPENYPDGLTGWTAWATYWVPGGAGCGAILKRSHDSGGGVIVPPAGGSGRRGNASRGQGGPRPRCLESGAAKEGGAGRPTAPSAGGS